MARGPGSVAYGSDAFGGVISVRTKRPGFAGWFADGSFTVGGGIPDRRGEVTFSQGFGSWRHSRRRCTRRNAEDYDGPDGEVLNSGLGGSRRSRARSSAAWAAACSPRPGRAISAATSSGRATTRTRSGSTTRSRTRTGSMSATTAPTRARSTSCGSRCSSARSSSAPTRIGFRHRRARATSSARTFRRTTSRSARTAQKLLGLTRLEFGADINGRYGLEAHDILIQYDLAGNIVSNTDNLSIDSARRTDTAGFFEIDSPLASKVSVSGGIRGDYVSNVNEGGYFGDRRCRTARWPATAPLRWARSQRDADGAGVARLPRPDAVGSVLPRAERPRLHHRQSRPRARNQPAGGFRRALLEGPVSAAGVHLLLPDQQPRRAVLAGDGLLRVPQSRARRNQGLRGWKLQADLGHGFSLRSPAQVGRGKLRGRRHQPGRHLDRPVVRACFARRSASSSRRSSRLAFYAEDDRPGPSEIVAPGHTNLDLGATWALHKNLEMRGAIRNLLDETYYASPDPAVRVRARHERFRDRRA